MSVFTNPASSTGDQATPSTLARLLDELPAGQLGQPEMPDKWSVNEVLQHLADSETVWAYRLRMVLAHGRPRLEGYDQDLWAERLAYRDADPHEAVVRFSVLRGSNLRLPVIRRRPPPRRCPSGTRRGESRALDSIVRGSRSPASPSAGPHTKDAVVNRESPDRNRYADPKEGTWQRKRM